jgi:hypothetical protein
MNSKLVNTIIKLVLFVAIIVIAYFIVVGIQKPIKFEEEREYRFEKNIDRLKDIRTAQNAFREATGIFTPDFDTLIEFINTGDIRVIRAIGFVPDSLTERKAVELGIVSRDTFYVPIKDSLFKHLKYPVEKIRYTASGEIMEWEMDTASVLTASGVSVKVFRAQAPIKKILGGMDEQLIINYLSLRSEEVMRVGSLEEADNSAGNWE